MVSQKTMGFTHMLRLPAWSAAWLFLLTILLAYSWTPSFFIRVSYGEVNQTIFDSHIRSFRTIQVTHANLTASVGAFLAIISPTKTASSFSIYYL